jgi:hypothetical protein
MTHARDWRADLVEAHPRLFDRTSGYPSCEEGWRDLLERMCERMETALREGETIRIVQIKEKFASLRCYWHRGNVSAETTAKIMEAIALAEARSACTCERCGAEGRLYNKDGFYMTRCAVHAEGAEVPSERGEIAHFVRRATADGSRSVRRRYDRETDTFTEVPPSTDQGE